AAGSAQLRAAAARLLGGERRPAQRRDRQGIHGARQPQRADPARYGGLRRTKPPYRRGRPVGAAASRGAGAWGVHPVRDPHGDQLDGATACSRSEEHTSELQSLAYLVCRLLLEKKKKKNKNRTVCNSMLLT